MKGGAREGAGRKAGSKMTRTVEIALEAAKAGQTPLEYLLSIMRNELEEKPIRLDAAKSAAPYIHPRLSSVEAKVDVTGHEAALRELE